MLINKSSYLIKVYIFRKFRKIKTDYSHDFITINRKREKGV
jgi:hypothetical protein